MKNCSFRSQITRRWGRKLICFEGTFEGFQKVLRPGESLLIEVFHPEEDLTQMTIVHSTEEFDGLFSYNLEHIRGIFAAPTSLLLLERTIQTEPQGLVACTVRRPVEDLVLSAVMKHLPAVMFI